MTLSTGAIQLPPDAFACSRPFGTSNTLIILDGSSSGSDWSATNGSLRKLQSALGQAADTVGVIASSATPSGANAVTATLSSWGVPSGLYWVSEGQRRPVLLVDSGCRGFVFAGNSPDSLARFLDAGTGRERTAGRVNSGAPLLFLSDDVLLAGEQGISQMYRSIYGAYYFYLFR